MPPPTSQAAGARARIALYRVDARHGSTRGTDDVAVEEPLEIQIETRPITLTLRTPGHDEELAAGFLVSEGILRERSHLLRILPYPRNTLGNVVGVFLAAGVHVDVARLSRHVFASSSCGLCGRACIDAVRQSLPRIRSRVLVDPATILSLPGRMHHEQATFHRTGGIHAAALFSSRGELLVLREDIGRHNAVDKVIGHAFLSGTFPAADSMLLVSGRASFEILQKALAARIPIVAAVGAPSSLAVEFARASGQTLIGFLRERRFNIYAGHRRIRGHGTPPKAVGAHPSGAEAPDTAPPGARLPAAR